MEDNILPPVFDVSVVLAIVLAVVAGVIVYQLDKMHIVKEQTKDIEDEQFEKDFSQSLKIQ
ncbi:MAG: hypothetical protein JW395_0723 [Nitrospira sp.]|nr:hypothetical protein [Nitrospira sp.]